ncbi:MAG: hypothetical protein PHG14_08000 [Desulfobacter postgatei]|uniref:hypothetical protein n=1 Tax=Desulfobacter postgatei TaxID=2293 RepID=UPI0023F43202|nr:hypothetical protein [Desulfobacter postgatei]MDD4273654.1 hypothetical protein [Desulfobacter postgatei]
MVYHTIPERALTDPSSTPEKFETASPKNPASTAQHPLTDVEKPDLPNEKPLQALLYISIKQTRACRIMACGRCQQ